MTRPTRTTTDQITALRRFNRFYTRQLGLLDETLLKTGFPLAETRVLYELAHRDASFPSDLVRDLDMDPGHLSRLVQRLADEGHVRKTADTTDTRRTRLALTAKGKKVAARLEDASSRHIQSILDRLGPAARKHLLDCAADIENLMSDAMNETAKPTRTTGEAAVSLRALEPGDLGWIIRRHGMLYVEEYGWDITFEGFVAEIAGKFLQMRDPRWENAWVAVRSDEILGSIFLVRQSDETGKLRLLYVEPSARGLGVGKMLVDACIADARAKGYKKLTLWTNDILHAARAIYVARGFKLVAEEKHHSFGVDLVGQNWDLDLV